MVWGILGGILVILLIGMNYWMKDSWLKQVVYEDDEHETGQHENLRVEVTGLGPELTVFPKCKLVITNKRYILAQKVFGGNKYKLHYFMWRAEPPAKPLGIRNGIVSFIADPSCVSQDDADLVITPKSSDFIKGIRIKNASSNLTNDLG